MKLLLLPNTDVHTPAREHFNQKNFWSTITCSERPYEAQSTKATWICNPVFRYLQCSLPTTSSPWANNQNGLRAGKLFLLWATLYSTHVNTGSFIASHLEEHAKSSKVAITVGGLITTLAQALGFSDRIGILWLLYTLGHIYLLVPF